MGYLPILDELFSSDTVIVLLAGVVISLLIGVMNRDKKSSIEVIICGAIYAACELLSNIRTNYFVEIILLLLGTAALGGVIGSAVSLIIGAFRKHKR